MTPLWRCSSRSIRPTESCLRRLMPISVRAFTSSPRRDLPRLASHSATSLVHDTKSWHCVQQARQASSIQKLFSLKDKVTVVTGGGRGIGLHLARTAAELGSNVAILDRLEKKQEDFQDLAELGVGVKYFRVDVTDPTALENTFKDIDKEFMRVDNCITAAGIVLDKPFQEHEWEESRRVLDVNIMGTFFSAELASKRMRNQHTGGSIIMIASVTSHCAIPSQRLPLYGASKGAVRILGKHLAVELAQHDIRVNTISPGYIETEMVEALAVANPELVEVFKTAPPMQRLGRPEDLSGVTAYLLSDASKFTTGTDIPVTGGLHAGRT